MIPLALRIKNFRSFKAEQSFNFPREPGLYFMQGLNEVEPRLGGNGCGKTTLWEALTWCLFGITADGLKAGDVCNWHAKDGVLVAFDFLAAEGDECIWTVTRTWGPISWKLTHEAPFVTDEAEVDLTKDKTNPVMEMLRMELEPWLNSILTAQGRPMFLDLKGEAQASLFSEVLGLERWIEYSKRMSEKARETDSAIRELEREHAKLRGELEGLEKQDFSHAHDQWEIKRLERILVCQGEHKDGLAKLKRLEGDVREAEVVVEVARGAVRDAAGDEGLAKDLRSAKEHHRALEDKLLQEKQALTALERHLVEVQESAKCPTCGQGLSKAQVAEEVAKARRAIEAVQAMMRRLKEKEGEAWDLVENLERRAEKEEGAYRRAREALDEAERNLANARRAVAQQNKDLDRLEDEAERLEGEENPYAGMARQATRNAAALRERLAGLSGRLDDAQERYSLQSYWAGKGFKEIRLNEIAEALTELEIEVNSAVTALGLVDWELRFAVDKEGKTGSIQRGFNVSVRSPHNPAATPWKAWSGGEKQRLRLAATMGLADLIRSRTGATLGLEVWDEPTNGLSPEGWDDLFEALATRARNEGRVIFITDHKAHDFGGFAGSATVIKRPSGSKVVTTWSKV